MRPLTSFDTDITTTQQSATATTTTTIPANFNMHPSYRVQNIEACATSTANAHFIFGFSEMQK